jgi:hypothetical protein
MKTKVLLIIMSLLYVSLFVQCEKEKTTATLKITVMNGNLVKLSGWSVQISKSGSTVSYSETTGADGVAIFNDIEAGSYSITVGGTYTSSELTTVSEGQTLNKTVVI